MIPFGLTQEQFVTRYRRWLDAASAQLIEELRKLIASQVPSTVTSAEIQIFLGDDGRNAQVHTYISTVSIRESITRTLQSSPAGRLRFN